MEYATKISELKKRVRELWKNEEDIDIEELSRKYELEYVLTKNITTEELKEIRSESEKTNTDDLLTKDSTIKTKETLAFLHKNSKTLIEKAIKSENYGTALQAMNTLSKQVELTMKKLGELNPDKKNDIELNTTTFLEFLIRNLHNEEEAANEIAKHEKLTEEPTE